MCFPQFYVYTHKCIHTHIHIYTCTKIVENIINSAMS